MCDSLIFPSHGAQDLKLLPRERAHCLLLTLSDLGRIDVKIGNADALQFPGTKDRESTKSPVFISIYLSYLFLSYLVVSYLISKKYLI